MKNKFTKQIAREIAENQFAWTLDCILGLQDPDFSLTDDISDFEQNFTEDLEQKNIIVTPKRIEIINQYYEKLVLKASIKIHNLYPKHKNKINMKNLSGKGNYLEMYDKRDHEKESLIEQKETVQLNDADVKLLLESYDTMCKETERLYEIKTLKDLHDINISLWSLKNSINNLMEHIEKN